MDWVAQQNYRAWLVLEMPRKRIWREKDPWQVGFVKVCGKLWGIMSLQKH